jgi:hypothetical protein
MRPSLSSSSFKANEDASGFETQLTAKINMVESNSICFMFALIKASVYR